MGAGAEPPHFNHWIQIGAAVLGNSKIKKEPRTRPIDRPKKVDFARNAPVACSAPNLCTLAATLQLSRRDL